MPFVGTSYLSSEVLILTSLLYFPGKTPLIDLKPQNVLLSEENDLKLCDFGLAQKNDDENKENLLLGGTLEYCAPEQIQFEQVSIKTDVWSLGVIGTFFR